MIQDEQQPIVGTEELHHGILVNDEDDGKTIYSGYVPLVLSSKPTKSVLGELPGLAE